MGEGGGELTAKRCVPCEGGIPKLGPKQARALLEALSGWTIVGSKLKKTYVLPDFAAAMRLLVRVGELAEAEGHHPDFAVHYNRVDFTIWTHAVGGLSENDFILAAKIDAL